MNTLNGRLALAAALCGIGGFAQAAPPQVNGKYAFQTTTLCAATLRQFKDAAGDVTDIAPQQNGLISAVIGYITFNNATKKAAITGSTLVEGASFRVQGKTSFAWRQHPDNAPAMSYSFTDTTFTLGEAPDQQIYKMVYADPQSQYHRTIYLLRRSNEFDNPDCVETISVTKVLD
jgi:hypothetical protein